MINRRNFLTTSGLLAGSALLGASSFGGRSARAAGEGPRRVVIFLEGNGTRPGCMRDPLTVETLEGIAGKTISSSRDYAHDDPVIVPKATLSEARALAALAAGDGEISLVDRAALVLGLSATNLGGGHTTGFGALSAARALGGPAAATIETVLGQIPGVRGNTPFEVIRLGIGTSESPLNYASCAFDKGKPAPILMSSAATFSTLFGSVSAGSSGDAYASRRDLLEFAIADVTRELKGPTRSSRRRAKIELYEASLLTELARMEKIEAMKDALLAVKPVEPGIEDPDPYLTKAPLEQLALQTDIAIAALRGGLTNVVVMSLGSGGGYWSKEYPTLLDFYPGKELMGGHDLRHGGDEVHFEFLHELTSRYIREMSRMARTLEAQPEEGGTMLDNTLLLYMSDNGERHHSTAEEWAMLMLGGDNMGFKTDGRSVTYPRSGHANNRQISNMFNSLLHAAGKPTDDFGHASADSRIAEGPLAEIWG